MIRRNSKRVLFTMTVLASVLTAVAMVLAVNRPSLAGGPAVAGYAPTDQFFCTPSAVGVFTGRVHVRCTAAAPPGGIVFFAVCTAPDPAHANRMLSVFTTAKVTAKNLAIFYTPSDTTSGPACGCANGDCRVAWAAEVQQ